MTAKAEMSARMVTTLGTVPILEDCEQGFIALVSQKMQPVTTVDAGHVFTTIGEEGDRMWILHEGSVQQKDSAGNIELREAVGDTFTPAFGGLALMEEGPRRFEFKALSPCKVSVLLRSDLRACFASFPSAESTMLTAVMNKYHLVKGENLSRKMAKDLIADLVAEIPSSGAAKTMMLDKKNNASDELLRRMALLDNLLQEQH